MLHAPARNPHFAKLWLISFLLVCILHILVAIIATHYIFFTKLLNSPVSGQSNEQDKQLNIRLLGLENASSSRGDLRQLKAPDVLFENDSPQKSLQQSKKIKNRQNVARILPTKRAPLKKIKKEIKKTQLQNEKQQLRKFSLSELGKLNKYQPLKKQEEKRQMSYRSASIQQYIEQARIFESLSGKLASLNLRNVSSSVQIEIPQGNITEDQLNSVEKRFYSFKRRVFQAYVQSLLTEAYNQQSSNRPFPFTDRSTSTSAKVIYDEKGNLVRIKILKPTQNALLQRVFINALQEIQTIPNPPKEIINGFGEFSQVYVLNIRF